MTEFEKELVRFVSGYLDAGVSAEDYVKAFSQRLLDSIGRQSKPTTAEGLEEEAESCWRIVFPDGGIETTKMALTHDEFIMCARHFAQWGAEHLKK